MGSETFDGLKLGKLLDAPDVMRLSLFETSNVHLQNLSVPKYRWIQNRGTLQLFLSFTSYDAGLLVSLHPRK